MPESELIIITYTLGILLSLIICVYTCVTKGSTKSKGNGKTYVLGTGSAKIKSLAKIKCLKCNKPSYTPRDVRDLYYPYCKTYHKK